MRLRTMLAAVGTYLGIMALLPLAVWLAGCASQPCYEAIVIPPRRTAIIVDRCRGEVFYQNVPSLPEEAPRRRDPQGIAL